MGRGCSFREGLVAVKAAVGVATPSHSLSKCALPGRLIYTRQTKPHNFAILPLHVRAYPPLMVHTFHLADIPDEALALYWSFAKSTQKRRNSSE
jgi:hypothetical protein